MVIFHDRSPASRVHLLAVPKRHIDNVKTLTASDIGLVERMKATGHHVLRQQGVEEKEQRFYSVNHLHLHLLSLPLPFPGSVKYRPADSKTLLSATTGSNEKLKGWSWFVDVDQALRILHAGERVRVGSVYGTPKGGTASTSFNSAPNGEAPGLV
ncbi:hypothetical protein C6P46_007024 [Rhodotorula mucilaginosa]|uniref:HIT domain-containing protein n=1 Tax=Rhodotorula mucilaginosa TaxID=5537 RepID=A0A9P6VXG4_RHOMI|nr:hypothetical protein C6P46_007024 [Rhodotorula mucilaginosa]TKA50566.1 hypothetical protein B0A53_06057 [Rhodotorula sp. CCFEE 5036]